MIIVKLQGGLGNQMFQYAIAKSLAKHHKTQYALDHRFLEDRSPSATHTFRNFDLDLFHVQTKRATENDLYLFEHKWPRWKSYGVKLNLLAPHRTFRELKYQFDIAVFEQGPHLYLDGYWQTPKYFAQIEDELRKEFEFVHPIEKQSASLLADIHATNAVCINVRRGDFLQNSFHKICDESYYSKAIDTINQHIAHPTFYLFGDDVEWFIQKFSHLGQQLVVVDHAHKGNKFGNYLQLMATCQHFIIPNSTFAWWAVWLANRPKCIVVAPKNWFNDPAWHTDDLLPEHWTLINNE